VCLAWPFSCLHGPSVGSVCQYAMQPAAEGVIMACVCNPIIKYRPVLGVKICENVGWRAMTVQKAYELRRLALPRLAGAWAESQAAGAVYNLCIAQKCRLRNIEAEMHSRLSGGRKPVPVENKMTYSAIYCAGKWALHSSAAVLCLIDKSAGMT